MARPGVIATAALAVFVLAACSSGHKNSTPTTTTTASTTIPESTTTASSSTTAPSATTTSVAPSTTSSSSVHLSGFTVTPPSPVHCTAPTSVELKWTASGATAVDLSIDGAHFASFGGGAQDHLEYFACDGKPHTYLLTARAGSATATASQVVTSVAG